jgi:hypothetical protein
MDLLDPPTHAVSTHTDAQGAEAPHATAPPREIPWARLRVWVYRDGSVRELSSLHALSGLSAWKSGRPPVGASFVAGTKLVDDPGRVDWTSFPEEEALEAEGEAPLPRAAERPSSPARRDARKLQVEALRVIARAPEGAPRASIHPRTAGALLVRGLIEVAVVEALTVLRCTTSGRALLHRPPRRRGQDLGGAPKERA